MDEKQARVNALRQLLASYDYIGTKIAMGRATEEEYAKEIAESNDWAAELNRLEAEIETEQL